MFACSIAEIDAKNKIVQIAKFAIEIDIPTIDLHFGLVLKPLIPAIRVKMEKISTIRKPKRATQPSSSS